jgi:phosphoribosylanthranilate isomerase
MAPLVKICGLKTEETLDCAIAHGADFVGFVFYPPSPRYVGLDEARVLVDRAQGRAKTVALLVNPDDDLLDAVIGSVAPDMLQLHGHESVARVQHVRQTWSKPVIKAVSVATADDVRNAAVYQSVADMMLFDAKAPKELANALPGGNGLPFDWELLDASAVPRPFMLSGGLTADNVATAISLVRPDAVDVSSGIECAPGQKDVALIRRFLEAAKA